MHARRQSHPMDAARRPVPVPVPGFGFRGQAAAVAGSASALLARVLPRRTYSSSRVRSIAVFSLACVSLLATTLILHAWLFAPPPPHHLHHQYNLQMKRQQQYMDSPRVHHKPDHPAATSVSAYTFADHPEMELGAVVNFLTLLSSNSLPVSIDPGQYIDPDLVLGFDTRADDDRVQIEVESIVEDTWLHNPVVIFSELRSTAAPASREAKTIINEFRLYPQPTIFEVDDRVDATVLRPLLRRLTHAQQFPVVLVAGKPYTIDELKAAKEDGTLTTAISNSAATIDGALLRKKKGH